MERRDFIKGGALAAAGITILPTGTLFAKNTQKVSVQSSYGVYGGEEAPGAPGNTLLFPRSAIKLENGDILIADTGNNRIVQVSKDKKVIWQLANLPRPVSVERL